MSILSKIQEEQNKWSLENFGEQPPLRMFTGLVEEFGELSETITEFELVKEQLASGKGTFNFELFEDALGDMVIYSMGLCNCMGWDLETLWDQRPNPKRDYVQIVMALGKLGHHLLKMEQGIRGSKHGHYVDAQDQLKRILAELHGMCEVADRDLVDLTAKTWAQVVERDWKNNKKDGLH